MVMEVVAHCKDISMDNAVLELSVRYTMTLE